MTSEFSEARPSTAEPGSMDDPVGDRLLFLARHFGRSFAPDQIKGGLPLPDGRVDAEHLAECAARAGLAVTPSTVAPQAVKASMLPALVTGEHDALVVLHRDGDRFECALAGIEGSRWLNLSDLLRDHPGQWHFVRPVFHFDARGLLYHLKEPRRWFWDTLLANRWIYGWALAATLVTNLLGAIVPFYSMAVYDRVVPNDALDSLWVLTTAAVAASLFDLVIKLLRGYLVDAAARRADLALSSRIFTQSLRLRAANRPASGGVLANIVRDFESVREFFASASLTVLGDLPFTLIYLLMILAIGGPLVLAPVVAMALALGSSWALQKPLARIMGGNMQDSAQRTAHLFEVMNGLDTVKTLGAEAWARRKWEMLSVRITEESVRMREISAFGGYLSTTFIGLETVLLVMFGAIMIGEKHLTMGQLIACSMLATRAISPATQLSALVLRWQQTRLALFALDQIMNAPTDDSQAGLNLPRLEGKVEFRDVGFAYPKSPFVLRHLTLAIAPGEKVAIIGRLGSGKSTAIKLLLNLYTPEEGSVLLDGIVAQQIDSLRLRRLVGYVPQDLTLFHGSIRDNLIMGAGEVDDATLMEAARIACLDEVLTQLPDGLETQVGERGERLSGGQRQAVGIARALARKPKLLLMDEPSSQMDPASESRFIANLKGALGGTTLVLVTHRMSLLPLVDRLVVMDQGKAVLDGPRDQVLAQLRGGPAPQGASA
ncbi:MAG: type I secretion system permease/ATPase [Rhodocyclaceae bacterium]|nr:type I secretion system permease/ATPase [Rhodocyclaceae bacterium]